MQDYFEIQSAFKTWSMKKSFLLLYFAAACILSVVLGLVYASVQQGYRLGANDPQIALATGIRERMTSHLPVDHYFTTDSIDLSRSLGVFAVFYNQRGEPLKSSALLDGKMPQVPAGVLDFVRRQGEERVTWQPRSGVRMAMVLLRLDTDSGGFIAAGRSLKEVEVREHDLLIMVFACWVVVVCAIGITAVVHLKFFNQ